MDKQVRCNLASNDVDTAVECKSNSRFKWEVTSTRCGMLIEKATRDDLGTFRCYMFAGNTSNNVETSIQVDVAVPALVAFAGQFDLESEVQVKAGEALVVECSAMGGYPKPELQASIGTQQGVISTDPKEDQILKELFSNDIPNSDGTVTVVKNFSLLVQSHDCGKYVKCVAVQKDDKGIDIFAKKGRAVESRKIQVLFAPEPLFKPLPPIFFGPGESTRAVKMNFRANPTPINNRAIWHINPTRQIGTDSIVVQAGSSYKDKYEALPLNISGHSVDAVLNIRNPSEGEAGYEYFLEVTTDVGKQRYNFELEYRVNAPLIKEPEEEYEDPSENESTDPESSGMGVGIVVAIIFIAVLVLGAIGAVVWMKTNKKFCFAEATTKPGQTKPSDQVDTVEKGNTDENAKLNTKDNEI